jgi:nitrite reductase/ring-hydroxylating ferredoxin subunit
MSSFPTGWFVVAHSAELVPGTVLPLRCFGRDLAAWRGRDGQAVVADAFCPHLGAHLGHGGVEVNGCVVCPFHAWRFDDTGRNVEIPYRDAVNTAARLELWPVEEKNGTVLVWHSEDGLEPTWTTPELPEIGDDSFLPPIASTPWQFRSHVQEVVENVVDAPHFQYIHGVEGIGDLTIHEEGIRLRALADVSFATPRGPVHGQIENDVYGLGVNFNRQLGLSPNVAIASQTPIDESTIEFRYTFLVPRIEGTDEPTNAARSYMKDYHHQIEQDIPIWENKRFRERPKLATGEKILQLRKWAAQFYPPGPARPSSATVGE